MRRQGVGIGITPGQYLAASCTGWMAVEGPEFCTGSVGLASILGQRTSKMQRIETSPKIGSPNSSLMKTAPGSSWQATADNRQPPTSGRR